MTKNETPEWLVKTQQKSWEPEILISGVTLTVLFIISSYIYNFFGMLVQDHAVYEIIAVISYLIAIMILTGLKIILIAHLVLRGIWTGLVGLSYVFPGGIKKQNLSSSNKHIKTIKPEVFVVKLENLCSLLFSFIFYMITSTVGIFIFSVPYILLFVIGLNLYVIHVLTTYVLAPLVILLILLSVVFSRRIRHSRLKSKIDNSIFNHTQLMYFSNIGKRKTNWIFGVYFLIVTLISYAPLSKFEFENHKGVKTVSSSNLPAVHQNHYESLRDQKLRVPKATIGHFRITGNTTRLFVSSFKEDMYTLRKLKADRDLLTKYGIEKKAEELNDTDLYTITIDNTEVTGLRWYITENVHTSQKGIITTIPLDSLDDGPHRLKIDKLYWSMWKNKMRKIENWELIPFEIIPRNNQPKMILYPGLEKSPGKVI